MTSTLLQRSLACLVALVVGMGQRATAQSPTRLGMAAGVTAPVSGYGDDKDLGYHLGLLLDIRVPATPLGFRIDGSFHELKYSANSTKEQIWELSGNMVVRLPTRTPITPYAIGGVGIYNSHRDLFFAARPNTDPGVNLGGGLRFDSGDLAFFVEARYHKVHGPSGIRVVPITIGLFL